MTDFKEMLVLDFGIYSYDNSTINILDVTSLLVRKQLDIAPHGIHIQTTIRKKIIERRENIFTPCNRNVRAEQFLRWIEYFYVIYLFGINRIIKARSFYTFCSNGHGLQPSSIIVKECFLLFEKLLDARRVLQKFFFCNALVWVVEWDNSGVVKREPRSCSHWTRRTLEIFFLQREVVPQMQ